MGDLGLLGAIAVLIGLACLGLALILLRIFPRSQRTAQEIPSPDQELAPQTDAVLLIQSGGRLAYANQAARQLFGLLEEEPRLERIARIVRPSDTFLSLCTAPGQARFTLNGRLVDGASFSFPYGDKNAILLAISPQPDSEAAGSPVADELIDIFTELSQTMAGSLDLTATLQAVLEGIERVIPADNYELTILDQDSGLLIPYCLTGLPSQDRRLERSEHRYRTDEGYSGFLASKNRPILIDDIESFREVRPVLDRKQYPYNAYLGIPLAVADKLLGTVELASLTKQSFTSHDLNFLSMLSGQAAVAVHNALLYQEEQRRILELTGLSKMSQAVSALQEPKDLYSRLVETIQSLLNAEVIGFWIYDENQNRLEAQIPFTGLPPDITELYHLSVKPQPGAEAFLSSQETIISQNAMEDTRIEALGLGLLAQAASLKSTVLAPLTTGGRLVGYLQAANKLDGSHFAQDDLRVLSIIAGQAAVIIENATLVQQTQRRALRSEALRRIASLIASTATLDETLQYSLRELAHLLQADAAAIFLLDESRGSLRLHQRSLFGVPDDLVSNLDRLTAALADSMFAGQPGSTARSFVTGDALDLPDALKIYRPFCENLSLRSVINVPLVVRDQIIGELMLANRKQNFYDPSDVNLIAAAAGQLAGAVDQASLFQQTDQTLRERVEQLSSLARVSRDLHDSFDTDLLVQRLYEVMLHSTQAGCGTILIFGPHFRDSQPEIIFQTGDHHTGTFSPLELKVIEQEDPLIISDYQRGHDLAEAGEATPPHSSVRSSLIFPIVHRDRITGLVHLHASTPDRFNQTSLESAQNLAVQAGIALENSQRYQEQARHTEQLTRRLETLTSLFEACQGLKPNQPLERSLEAIAYSIQEATPFDLVMISAHDPETGLLTRAHGVGFEYEQQDVSQQPAQTWEGTLELLKPEFKVGQAYFIPGNGAALTDVESDPQSHLGSGFSKITPAAWQPNDVLLLPLAAEDGGALGLIRLDCPRDGLRPDPITLEGLEIFAAQAGLTIEGYRQLQAYRNQLEDVQQEALRARQAVETARSGLPILLQKDLDQTIAIQRLDRRTRRIQAGFEIAEALYRQPNRTKVFQTLCGEVLLKFELDIGLVAEPGPGGPRLVEVAGPLPDGINPGSLLGQRNPIRQSLQTGENLFAHDLDEQAEWKTSPLLQALDARAFICIVIPRVEPVVETEQDSDRADFSGEAALLAISLASLPSFTAEDQQLFELLSHQVAIALRSQHLLSETDRRLREVNLLLDFSRQLGSLDPDQILHTLVESVSGLLPAAQASMVALWDETQKFLIPRVAAGYRDNQQMCNICYRAGEALPGQVFEAAQARRIDEINFARQYNLSAEDLLIYRKATGDRLPVSNLIVPITGPVHAALDGSGSPSPAPKPLGVLVIDNFASTAAFSSEDQALVASLAQQTALTLENARLYQASEQRALQLQALTTVAATITSSLETNQLIASLLDQVRNILPYETGTLWLRQGDRLTIRAANGFLDNEERIGVSLAVDDSLLLQEMVEAGRPISVADVREDARFPALDEHSYLSWLGIPLIAKGAVVGVIALEKRESGFYSEEQIQAAATFAGQAAVALENARLYEESVGRAQELDQRSQRLALLNRLSTELSSSLDSDYILKLTVQEMLLAMNCSSISAISFDKEERAFVHAEQPQISTELPMLLPYAPIFKRTRESLGIFNLSDVYENDGETVIPLLAPLAGYLKEHNTRGLMVLPLAAGSDLPGIVFVHQEQPHHFSSEEVELARTITNQAAVAVQNARLLAETHHLFAETRQRSHELGALFELGVQLSQTLDHQQLIDLTAENLFSLLEIDSAALVLQGENEELTAYVFDKGVKTAPILIKPKGETLSELVLQEGQPLLIADLEKERETLPNPGQIVGIPTRSWFGAPLVVRGAPVGVLSVQSEQPGRFGEDQTRLVGQIANQIAVALDNARLISTVQNYAADLEKRVAERTAQLAREHERTGTLLSIITELSTSLDMDIVLERTLSLVNEAARAEHSLILLGSGDEPALRLRASAGLDASERKRVFDLPLQQDQGLAGWVITNRQSVVISDLLDDPRWEQPNGESEPYRSALAVPLMMGEDPLGALLLFHQQPSHFAADQLDMIEAAARQIAVALNNAQLFSLIRDQAERLGDMLRQQHIETSRSQAILEAVADGVLVTGADRVISLFNASAEQILGLQRDQVLGRSLEHFIGLFGKAGQTWVETIQRWSADPASYQFGDIYSEQIELEDGRVVSVHLSPVLLGKDFLGTVSTFRDITHQVEIDRLKSEFVATVSHELRTPMTSIKGYVDILLMEAAGKLNDQQAHFLEVVRANTERLAVLVNDLLDVSRIEAGKVTLSFEAIDLRSMANKAIAELKQRTHEDDRPMTIKIQASKDLPHVLGDPERVRQILDNLLENAYYYTPENGRIRVVMKTTGQEIQVDIQDNGIGILPKDQARIFERFFRGEDPLVLGTSGTGLGLAIVQHLVEMHNGRIWFESSGVRGKGSIFSFTLPLYPSNQRQL
jgi:PAS domain S-box-containing protein